MSLDHKQTWALRLASTAIEDCKRPFEAGILGSEAQPWIQNAVLSWTIIKLNDALQVLKDFGRRIDFREDLAAPNGGDITNLVAHVRNACTHPNSPKHLTTGHNYALLWLAGKTKQRINERVIECKFDDDVLVSFGDFEIDLRRNVMRAVLEAEKTLAELGKDA